MRLALALACVVAGCAASPDPGETRTLAPFALLEVDKHLAADAAFMWEWSSSVEVRWDLHSHPDGVIVHEQGSGVAGDGTFTALHDGVYSLSWRTAETPAELWFRVDRPYVVA